MFIFHIGQRGIEQGNVLVLNALKNDLCSGFVINMGGQIPVVQEVDPCLLILDHAEGKRLFDDRFRAVDLGVALIEQVFPHGFPCQLRAELEPLDHTIPDGIQRHFFIIVQSFPQAGNCVCKVTVFFVQLVHQFHTILFDVCQKGRVHAVGDMNDIKFQQGGQLFAVHPEIRPVRFRHPVHGQIDIAVVPMVSSGTGTVQHKPLCAIPACQRGQLTVEFFHDLILD